VYVTPPYSLSHAFAGTSPPPSPALDSGAGLGAGLGVGAIAVLIVAIVLWESSGGESDQVSGLNPSPDCPQRR